jgi:hypothetical protein
MAAPVDAARRHYGVGSLPVVAALGRTNSGNAAEGGKHCVGRRRKPQRDQPPSARAAF